MNGTILITGTTGLIGFNIVNYLLHKEDNIKIIGLVRSIEKAKKLFQYDPRLSFVVADVTKGITIDESVDYIIHAASQTSSKAFVNEPVETIKTAIQGTSNMLEFAKEKRVQGFVYLSTMEVYGAPSTDEKISELYSSNLYTMSVRSSYPESKRMCEAMCAAYCAEYGVPAKVVRLTQTFGPGVSYHDGRVFAEFARCIIEKRDIVLHTKGETKRNYLSTYDAVSAILLVMEKGENGEVYNAANEETYCSIYEMAVLVAQECAQGAVKVLIEEEMDNKRGYAPVLHMNLDTKKLRQLGWKPSKGLKQMFDELIIDMKEQKE